MSTLGPGPGPGSPHGPGPSGAASRRRGRSGRRWASVVVLLLIAVPLLELYVLVQVGQVIGAGWTIVLLLLSSVAGGWLLKREGSRAWRALREAIENGRMPRRELADGALVVLGATLMLAPGFVSDALGVLMILPFTRPAFRVLLAAAVARRIGTVTLAGPAMGPTMGPRRRPGQPDPDVVSGEVVDDDR